MLPNSLTRFAIQMLNSESKPQEYRVCENQIIDFQNDYFTQLIELPVIHQAKESDQVDSNTIKLLLRRKRIRKVLSKQNSSLSTCKCVKSQCLKQYCECYSSGVMCGDKCQCLNCGNQRTKDQQAKKISSSCNCKRSGCIKKYCDCFINGKACDSQCKCEGCNNITSHQIQTDLDQL